MPERRYKGRLDTFRTDLIYITYAGLYVGIYSKEFFLKGAENYLHIVFLLATKIILPHLDRAAKFEINIVPYYHIQALRGTTSLTA